MKIGLITLHRSFSYGACLQTLATQMVLSDMGHDVEVIDYENYYERKQRKIITWRNNYSFKKNIFEIVKNLCLQRIRNQKRAYGEFHNLINKTNNYYVDKYQLNNVMYDVLVSGSDQLWNSEIFGGIEPMYFLQFGNCPKKISYAASRGDYEYSAEEKKIIAEYLNEYSAISVREKKNVTYFENICKKHIQHVADPTMLIETDRWLELCKNGKCPDGEFILVYLIGVPYSYYQNIIEEISHRLGTKIYYISPDYIRRGKAINLVSYTPWDLLQTIYRAKYILTSSFHGLSFAVYFNKKFIALENPTNKGRLKEFLNFIGLEERIINKEMDDYSILYKEIDYGIVNEKIELFRKHSLKWLSEQID